VIVEKPLVRTRAEAQRLAELVRSLTIVPVGVWLSSRVTELVSAQLGHGGVGQMRTLRIEQSKPRFARSAASRGHASALEVELPHQLLLALHLAGTEVQILEARTWDLLGPGGSIPALGGAHVVLEHQGGTLTTLATDLGAPVRMRRLTLTGTRGRVTADFPLGTGEDFGQVRLPSGQRVVVHDAPLTRLLHEAYAYFEGRGAAPPGSVGLHVRTIELLADIASIAEASAPAEPRETLFDYTVAA
jgi:predicted dehydrogenase